jgi:Leucine-rich repeat (LRR) protein
MGKNFPRLGAILRMNALMGDVVRFGMGARARALNLLGILWALCATTVCFGAQPVIISQPFSHELVLYAGGGCEGQPCQRVRFSCSVLGDEPLRYQWQKDGIDLADGNGAGGVNTAELVLANVMPASSGSYWLIVSNDFGSVTSAPAILNVTIPLIEDVHLEDAIRKALGDKIGPIGCAELHALTNLITFDAHIKSLKGLECAEHLQLLWVGGNYVGDLSPLQGLQELNELAIYNMHGRLSDLTPLLGLTNLSYLDVRCNPSISNLTTLGTLAELNHLFLGGNGLTDVGFLTNHFELRTLDVGQSYGLNLMQLTGLTNLAKLDVSYSTETELEPLAVFTNVGSLFVSGARLRGGLWLTNLPGLSVLSLFETELADVTFLQTLTNLSELNASGNSISDWSPIRALVRLESLWIYGNEMTDIPQLGELRELRHLDLKGNRLQNLNASTFPTALVSINLDGNLITNCVELAGLTNLTELALGANLVGDVSFLGWLPELTSVALQSNLITDATVLGKLANLKEIDLSGNQLVYAPLFSVLSNLWMLKLSSTGITNLSEVGRSVGLKYLDISGNLIADASALTNLVHLEKLRASAFGTRDWSFLGGLSNVEQIGIARNSFRDLAMLSALPNLRRLDASDNALTNIASVGLLTNLAVFQVSSNRLLDISALSCLPRLGEVDLTQNVLDRSETARGILNCLGERQVAVQALPQRIGPSITFTNMGNLAGSNFWPMALGERSRIGFFVQDDAAPESVLGVVVQTSDPALVPQANLGVQGTGSDRLLTLEALPGAIGDCTVTLTVSDNLGLRTAVPIVINVSELVSIPDLNLEAAMRAALSLQVATVTRGALETLREIHGEVTGITNLEGLQFATNLNGVYLSGNVLENLSALAELVSLSRLSLSNVFASDISWIVGLTNLTFLDLSLNPVTNWFSMSDLAKLESLVLNGDRLSDIRFLTNLPALNVLDLTTNRISDVSAFTGLTNLAWVGLEQNRLASVDTLTNLSTIRFLDLRLNLLDIENDPAIAFLEGTTQVLDLPQREGPFLDVRTNWVVSPHHDSNLPFNVYDTGPADEKLVVYGGIAPDLDWQLTPPPARDEYWILTVAPTVDPGSGSVVVPITLMVTNDVGLWSNQTVYVNVSLQTQVTGDLLGAPELFWETGGNAQWFGQGITRHDGGMASQSGTIGNYQQSWLQTVVRGPGRLSFWWKVSSEETYDWLTFTLGEEAQSISGEVDWDRMVVNVPPGLQTARWEYRKDENASHGLDAGWLEQVRFEPGIWMETPITAGAGGVTFIFHGVPGHSYELLSSTNWAEWSSIPPAVLVTNTSQTLSDTNKVEGFRLYQLHEVFLTVDSPILRDAATLEIRVHNPTGFNPEVEFSPNLVNWVLVGKIKDTANLVSILDVFSTNTAARYYRAVVRW